jgi:hypothetical protein
MENLSSHSGLAAAHTYRESMSQAQLARPTARPLACPYHWGTAKRAHGIEQHGVATVSAPTVASSPPTGRRWKLEAF